MLAGHRRTHTVVAAEGSFQRQVLPGCSCRQQQPVGHMIHNFADRSSAEKDKKKEQVLAARENNHQQED